MDEEAKHLLAAGGAIGVDVAAAPTAAALGLVRAVHAPVSGNDGTRFAFYLPNLPFCLLRPGSGKSGQRVQRIFPLDNARQA